MSPRWGRLPLGPTKKTLAMIGRVVSGAELVDSVLPPFEEIRKA